PIRKLFQSEMPPSRHFSEVQPLPESLDDWAVPFACSIVSSAHSVPHFYRFAAYNGQYPANIRRLTDPKCTIQFGPARGRSQRRCNRTRKASTAIHRTKKSVFPFSRTPE